MSEEMIIQIGLLVFAISLFLGLFILSAYNMKRIRESARRKNWTIIDIDVQEFRWTGWWEQSFKVEYSDLSGKRHTRFCAVHFRDGVKWEF